LRHEGAEILSLLLKSLGERLPGLDQDVVEVSLAGEPKPTVISAEENEAEIVNLGIELAWLERLGITHRQVEPLLRVSAVFFVEAAKDPQYARKEAVAPVGP